MPANYLENERFQGLRFTEEVFEGFTLVDCSFSDCVFERCTALRCVLTECRFQNCRIADLKCEYSQVKFLALEQCSLTGVNWGLLLPSGGFGTPLERLEACRLKYCFFTGMDLRRFSFSGSALQECMFTDCRLGESDFQDCGLGGTEFFRCDLSGADFRQARDYRVDLPSCTVKGAKFSLPEAADLLCSLGIRLD